LVVPQQAECEIALMAQQAAHPARLVTVVDAQHRFRFPLADRTHPPLPLQQQVILFRSDAVCPHQIARATFCGSVLGLLVGPKFEVGGILQPQACVARVSVAVQAGSIDRKHSLSKFGFVGIPQPFVRVDFFLVPIAPDASAQLDPLVKIRIVGQPDTPTLGGLALVPIATCLIAGKHPRAIFGIFCVASLASFRLGAHRTQLHFSCRSRGSQNEARRVMRYDESDLVGMSQSVPTRFGVSGAGSQSARAVGVTAVRPRAQVRCRSAAVSARFRGRIRRKVSLERSGALRPARSRRILGACARYR